MGKNVISQLFSKSIYAYISRILSKEMDDSMAIENEWWVYAYGNERFRESIV